jgi:hypothetical protein
MDALLVKVERADERVAGALRSRCGDNAARGEKRLLIQTRGNAGRVPLNRFDRFRKFAGLASHDRHPLPGAQ